MLYVAYCKESSESGKALAEKLECGAFHSRKPKKYPRFKKGDIVVNYGSSSVDVPDFVRIFNLPAAVGRSANKKVSREILTEKGLPLPKLYTSLREIDKYPVIARPDYHTQAKNFWLCLNKLDAVRAYRKGATHYMELIRNTKELRIHVFSSVPEPKSYEDYVSIKASVKLPSPAAGEKVHPIIKNYENGYKFFAANSRSGLPDYKLNECREVAKKAVHSLELHFGAVDLVVSYGNIYILESNTSPSLTGSMEDTEYATVNKYADSIRKFFLQGK